MSNIDLKEIDEILKDFQPGVDLDRTRFMVAIKIKDNLAQAEQEGFRRASTEVWSTPHLDTCALYKGEQTGSCDCIDNSTLERVATQLDKLESNLKEEGGKSD